MDKGSEKKVDRGSESGSTSPALMVGWEPPPTERGESVEPVGTDRQRGVSVGIPPCADTLSEE